ncbi:MarR family transcriptional regulator [Staphylococcus succinus]|jgi:DNA-binding MarR family transcriptional regulator|uniref:MarR family transcriptional regulator n=1 Tax=Staphylococcus succinus TaxID=61015 RepID=A0A9Q6HS72_9STAP|nr:MULTISPECIES: MarR family transcriptional regulator [Staphylococcus]MBU0438663.1 MarR family transcriptional regulator [Staphylococcus succinus]MDH9160592.1 MarR family transcriptional regulator [Staphylococcus succinus]MEB7462908.1 MarR family transcriptional regulator [Staphylococcus succinus]MEB8123758.1 MarR family transcriptional regulator [Staphylococcus succinus]MEB8127539.1 MarR family transcriptional regulator [Staphylococcus succinus]
MENVDQTIEVAINKFQVVMLRLNKEIVEIVKETGLANLLSREQIEAMRIIQTEGKVTINELATLQNIFKTAASKRVAKLEDMGYVQRAHSDNKRIKLIMLSSEGEAFLKEATTVITKAVKARLGNKFTTDEIEQFVDQLTHIDEVFRESKS